MSAPALAAEPVPLWRGLGQVPAGFGPCAVTLGVFDGMHRGHARLVRQALRLGRARGLATVLVTFDPHPASVLGLARDTARLSTVEHRAELAGNLGVDAVCVLEFTRELAACPPERFVQHVLVDGLRAQAVAVGANFTFGHRAAGTVDTLHTLGQQHGFTTHPVGLLHEADTRCSSSFIRECLHRGDMRAAAATLGRPHRIEGTLHPAGPRTCQLVPTAADTALPAPGDYHGTLTGTGRTELRVTRQHELLVRTGTSQAGPVAVAFTDRKERL